MPLQEIADEIWIADGPTVSFYGFPYPTRMAVVRLENGDLWVWSPVGLDPELRAGVEALGPVRHLVSPNKIHHLFLAEWAKAWPDARLYASPGLARRRLDLDFSAELGDRPEPAWDGSWASSSRATTPPSTGAPPAARRPPAGSSCRTASRCR